MNFIPSMYSYNQIKQAIQTKNYSWFEKGNYNLNIVGIRSTKKGNEITNQFDDLLTLSYKIGDTEVYHEYFITTEPGIYYSKNLLNKEGVAILVPNQYKGTWQIGLHRGKYKALVQRKTVQVYRDKNKDNKYDMNQETIDDGLFGINIHHSSATGISTQIDKWSAGCQVFQNIKNFNEFMLICDKASKAWGNSFTYSLILDTDVK